MARGKKKSREAEYLRTGQSAALRPGDLGAKDIYDDGDDDEDGDVFTWSSPTNADEEPEQGN